MPMIRDATHSSEDDAVEIHLEKWNIAEVSPMPLQLVQQVVMDGVRRVHHLGLICRCVSTLQ